MRSNLRTLAFLAVLFVALALALVVQQGGLTPTGQPVAPTAIFQRLFPDLEVRQLQAIRLLVPYADESFTIARAADGTWAAPGYEGRLDPEAATVITRTVVLLPYRHRFLPPEDADLEQYGFVPDQNEFAILFVTLDGEQHSINIGFPSRDSPTFYVLVDDRPEIYLVERPPLDVLAGYFRERPILDE
jgi:hypothetical protein